MHRLTMGMLALAGTLAGWTPSVTAATTTNAPLPGRGDLLVIDATAGQVGGKTVITLGGGRERLTLTGADCPEQNKHYPMTRIPKEIQLRDGALSVQLASGLRFAYYIRPNIRYYGGKAFEAALQQWDRWPAASEQVFSVRLRRLDDAVEWWLDGRYLTRTPLGDGPEELTVSVSDGAGLRRLATIPDPSPPDGRLLPLDLAGYRHFGGDTPLAPPEPLDAGLLRQVLLEPGAGRIDVGRSRWLGQAADSGSFYDRYYVRGAFDGIPESLILRVPKRFYTRVWLLCAVDPAASPWMTVRIGRYRESWDGSGMSVGDTHVKIDPNDPAGLLEIQPAGRTTLQRDGAAVEIPLYRVAVPLATDQVADYLQWKGNDPKRQDFGAPLDWFYLEFSRKIETRRSINSGIFDAKPLGPASGVSILDATLQSEPVQVLVHSPEEGYSFYLDAQPALLVETRNDTARTLAVSMQADLTDFDGATLVRTASFQAPPGVATNTWRLDGLPAGWFDARLRFSGQAGDVPWFQHASLAFALLPPDTRRAGAESPYGTWWFQGSHYTEPDPARMLPLFRKMGFRHSSPNIKGDAALFQAYQVTPSMMGYKGKATATNTLPWTSFMTNWPTVKTAMIFHETGIKGLSTALPHELTGAPPEPFSDEQRTQLDALRAKLEEQATTLRKLDPEMKIMVGNGTTIFNTLWFREQLPTTFWDVCGLEMAVQTLHPEGQPNGWNLQSFWIARQMADHYGYTNFPVSTCFEVGYRPTAPGGLSLKRQADWYARDVLHMLAWRSPHINVGLLADVNASYYTSRWGSTGVFGRSPLHLPKPAFVSLATLTLQLDQAEFRRCVPTGSTGVYCFEFARGRETVYAVWCSRGRRAVTLSLDGRLREVMDSMGRKLDLALRRGQVELPASESPLYVVARGTLEGVALGDPLHDNVVLGDSEVVAPLRQAAQWRVRAQGDETFGAFCDYWPMVPGAITLEGAAGDGLALTLNPQPGVKPIVARYAVLEPVQGPLPVAGTPDTLGVWVKGNSGWGRIVFEIVDANGHRWRSNRGEEQSWDLSDWEGETSINHDGWRLVSLPLPDGYPSGYYKPSMRHWRRLGEDEDGIPPPPAYPIAVTRLFVVLREQLVYGTTMTAPASPTIVLRDLTAGRRADGGDAP